jgi:hypothetical protein
VIDLSNGWKTIDQPTAEAMLLRNPIGANRRPTLPAVKYYARQMADKKWKKTGQAILFDTDGKLLDAGHRLWAAYLSGASFESYVIGDVPADPECSLYRQRQNAFRCRRVGNSRPQRSVKSLALVVAMAMRFEQGLYTASSKKSMDKVAPIEVVHYVQEHNNLRKAVRLVAGEYKAAAKVIEYKDVAAFVAFQVLELHGEETLDGFMSELGHVGIEHEDGSPIGALQKVMEEDETSKEPMEKHQVLGHVIKGFNAWVSGETIRKITLKVNETFPRFVKPQPAQQAAE